MASASSNGVRASFSFLRSEKSSSRITLEAEWSPPAISSSIRSRPGGSAEELADSRLLLFRDFLSGVFSSYSEIRSKSGLEAERSVFFASSSPTSLSSSCSYLAFFFKRSQSRLFSIDSSARVFALRILKAYVLLRRICFLPLPSFLFFAALLLKRSCYIYTAFHSKRALSKSLKDLYFLLLRSFSTVQRYVSNIVNVRSRAINGFWVFIWLTLRSAVMTLRLLKAFVKAIRSLQPYMTFQQLRVI